MQTKASLGFPMRSKSTVAVTHINPPVAGFVTALFKRDMKTGMHRLQCFHKLSHGWREVIVLIFHAWNIITKGVFSKLYFISETRRPSAPGFSKTTFSPIMAFTPLIMPRSIVRISMAPLSAIKVT